ncbi:hypothetical protein ABS71_09015 [bacterium SCN 62-11]|nr:hypothetical protein [Candidatus Eremiobacteraeota bacterium]ODT69474.1 MAG: hypothetical protein ABS71_09015 [bacterium SCN 62-11]
MFKRYLPEFLASIAMSVLLLIGYAMRGSMAGPPHVPNPKARVEPRFLLEVENPKGTLRVGNHGEVSGLREGKIGETDFVDLRLAAQQLRPGSNGGKWKLRFYDEKGAHENTFELEKADPNVQHILDNLRILGYLDLQPAHQKSGQSRAQ